MAVVMSQIQQLLEETRLKPAQRSAAAEVELQPTLPVYGAAPAVPSDVVDLLLSDSDVQGATASAASAGSLGAAAESEISQQLQEAAISEMATR